MKRNLVLILFFASVTATKAQSPAEPGLVLKDTSFEKLGVKFGYPANYFFSPTASSADNMVFYKDDSSIILSVKTTGTTLQKATEGWPEKEKHEAKDHWFRHVGTTARRHVFSSKPLYSSDNIYPFTYGGADYIWITVLTTKPYVGLKEMETVKKSVALANVAMETREIIPGRATMELPVYFESATPGAAITAFKSGNRLLEVYKAPKEGVNSAINSNEDLKKTALENGFTIMGNIKFRSAAGVTYTGFYGRLVRKTTGKSRQANVFFEDPASKDHSCYGIRITFFKGFPLNLGKDFEAMLATIKLL